MHTLKKLCLNLIVEEFELFYFVFTVSKDKKQRQKFEFLQRRYSVALTTKLHSAKKLKDEYFELLMNEHLTYLSGEWFCNSCYRTSMENIFCRIPNLQEIDYNDCDDEVLKLIAKFCPKITDINVSNSKVTDTGVKYLCERNGKLPCPEIEFIHIENSCVTDIGAECLIRNLPLLKKTFYPNVPKLLHSIHEKQLSESGEIQLFNLVSLKFDIEPDFPNYGTLLKTCLDVCPKLESMFCYVSDKDPLIFTNNRHLKKLVLWSCVGIVNINNALNGSNLTCLRVGKCSMSISLLSVHCPALKEFEARYVTFTVDKDVKVNFPFLIKCGLGDPSRNPSTEKAIVLLLSSSPKLESLTFGEIKFKTNFPLSLRTFILLWCKTCCLKEIAFEYVYYYIEMEFFQNIILNCTTLNEMRVSSCSVETDAELMEATETTKKLAKNLPNKPRVTIVHNKLFEDEE